MRQQVFDLGILELGTLLFMTTTRSNEKESAQTDNDYG
jgi:hypothetical protein